MKNLILEKTQGTALVTFNRPEKLNALNQEVINEFYDILGELNDDEDIKIIALTGKGDKAFIAGADISEMSKMSEKEALDFSNLGQICLNLLEETNKPTVALVNGYALGGGQEVALACDMIYATSNAKFGQPEVGLGLIPGFGGTQRLIRKIGINRARELIYTGRVISADDAYQIGIVNKVFKPEELMEGAQKLFFEMSKVSPLAIAYCKEAIREGIEKDQTVGMELERRLFSKLFNSFDQKEGCQAFLEKRKAEFKGR